MDDEKGWYEISNSHSSYRSLDDGKIDFLRAIFLWEFSIFASLVQEKLKKRKNEYFQCEAFSTMNFVRLTGREALNT